MEKTAYQIWKEAEEKQLTKEEFKEVLIKEGVIIPKKTCDNCGSKNTKEYPHLGDNCEDCNPVEEAVEPLPKQIREKLRMDQRKKLTKNK